MGDSKLEIIAKPKHFHFDLPKDVTNNLKHEVHSTIKHNELLVEHTIKDEIRKLLSKYKHGKDIHVHGKQQNQ